MTTIIINERTKAGKSFLEFAKNLSFVKIKESNKLLKDFETACQQLKESKSKNQTRKSLTQLI